MADQVRQALLNIVAVLAEAGGAPGTRCAADLVCHQPRGVLRTIGRYRRSLSGRDGKALSDDVVVQVVALMEKEALVEIEADRGIAGAARMSSLAEASSRAEGFEHWIRTSFIQMNTNWRIFTSPGTIAAT